MNYLQLAQRTRQEAGLSGTGPTAVTSQSGDLKRVVDWVSSSYQDIQSRHINWRWLRSRFTFNTVSGTDTYAYTAVTDSRLTGTITRFSRWWLDDEYGMSNTYRYLTSAGSSAQSYLIPISWESFRDLYRFRTQADAVPIYITIDPQNNLVLGPAPDAIYTITGEYQMSPQILAADADTPEMPVQYHMAIVYEAMQRAGSYSGAPDVQSRGVKDGNRLMRQLENDQLPQIGMSGPMA